MANDWILDVLADLKTFAARNDLGALAAQLDRTVTVAASEIASHEARALAPVGWNGAETRVVHRTVAIGDDA